MSTGMFHLLPVLKGWKWAVHNFGPVTLQRGEAPVEWEVTDEFGWLIGVYLATTDCRCKAEIIWTGGTPGRTIATTQNTRPEDLRDLGAFAQDPCGWLQRYTRPIATSTFGIYTMTLWSGGGQGSPLPYLDKTKVRMSLEKASTQSTCSAYLQSVHIQINKMDLFIQSLRAVYAIRNMKVDKNLLEYGSQTFGEGLL